MCRESPPRSTSYFGQYNSRRKCVYMSSLRVELQCLLLYSTIYLHRHRCTYSGSSAGPEGAGSLSRRCTGMPGDVHVNYRLIYEFLHRS